MYFFPIEINDSFAMVRKRRMERVMFTRLGGGESGSLSSGNIITLLLL